MQDWVFGCDLCQEVCPVNRRILPGREAAFGRRDLALLELTGLLSLTEEEFRRRFRGTPILRAKRTGLKRNACVALGNRGDPATVPALAGALGDAEPLVRMHAAWALGRIGGAAARTALEQARDTEQDLQVREEISEALGEMGTSSQPPKSSNLPPGNGAGLFPPFVKGGQGGFTRQTRKAEK
jgi:epoxyqueuosine reductase